MARDRRPAVLGSHPAELPGADPRASAARTAPVEQGPLPLVLVVDDYAEARDMYVAWLEVSGYRVVTASTAAAALALAHADPPAAILMDLSLPGMDGLDATRRLKAATATADVPVVAMTGHVEARVAEAAQLAGCDAFVVKPTPVQDVLRLLGDLVARRVAGARPLA